MRDLTYIVILGEVNKATRELIISTNSNTYNQRNLEGIKRIINYCEGIFNWRIALNHQRESSLCREAIFGDKSQTDKIIMSNVDTRQERIKINKAKDMINSLGLGIIDKTSSEYLINFLKKLSERFEILTERYTKKEYPDLGRSYSFAA